MDEVQGRHEEAGRLSPREFLWAVGILTLQGHSVEEAERIVREDVEPKFNKKMEELGA